MSAGKFPVSSCPQCATRLDDATSLNGKCRPSQGDIGVCAYCGLILCYGEDLVVRRAVDADLVGMTVAQRTATVLVSKIAQSMAEKRAAVEKARLN
jgi:hypothetical protein